MAQGRRPAHVRYQAGNGPNRLGDLAPIPVIREGFNQQPQIWYVISNGGRDD